MDHIAAAIAGAVVALALGIPNPVRDELAYTFANVGHAIAKPFRAVARWHRRGAVTDARLDDLEARLVLLEHSQRITSVTIDNLAGAVRTTTLIVAEFRRRP